MEALVVELNVGSEIGSGVWSSPMPQRRHCATPGEHGGLGKATSTLASSVACSASTLTNTTYYVNTPSSTTSEHHLLGQQPVSTP